MNNLYMLIGLPGSGKSTWIKTAQEAKDAVIISTDDEIENYAKAHGKTYDEVFSQAIKSAEANMKARLYAAVRNNRNIVWDQTNLTEKSRARKLSLVPNSYRRHAIVFNTPIEVIKHRLTLRPGKTIPKKVFDQMERSMQYPSFREDWDKIIFIE